MDRPIDRPRNAWRRLVVLAAAGVVALGVAGVVLAPAVKGWIRAEKVVEASRLRIAEVVRGDLERDVAAQGRVVAALHPTLYSPAQGIVTLLVKPGAEVKKGQVLARIDSPELASRLAQERATLSQLQSELGRQQITARQAAVRTKQTIDVLSLRREAATRALKRIKSLHEQGLQSSMEYEKADDDLQIAELELKNAGETARLEKDTLEFEERNRRLQVQRQQSVAGELERQVAELQVTSPFDGMVAAAKVQDRDAVVRNQALLSVVNLSAFEIEVELPENYASEVTPGTPAEVQAQGKTYAARVTAVSPEIRDGQVRATVAFRGEAPVGLRQSERLTTRVVLDRRNGVLKLPRGAFLESGGGRLAYVVEGGMAVQRAIETGALSVSEVEIARGLAAGDRVVVSETSLFEGARNVLIRP